MRRLFRQALLRFGFYVAVSALVVIAGFLGGSRETTSETLAVDR